MNFALNQKNHRSKYKTKKTKNIKLLEKTGDNIFMIPGWAKFLKFCSKMQSIK